LTIWQRFRPVLLRSHSRALAAREEALRVVNYRHCCGISKAHWWAFDSPFSKLDAFLPLDNAVKEIAWIK